MTVRFRRQGLGARRLAVAGAAGAVTLVVAVAAGAGWVVAATSAWSASALAIVVWVWAHIGRMDAAETAAYAQEEDFSRATADLVALGASVASLVAVGLTLVDAGHRSGGPKALLILLAITAVALSWATVHTIYTVRYGDLYYAPPVGGIDFEGEDAPDYRDFAYVALTIGMTFQVSDTDLSSRVVRRTATRHALLSYLFGAVIVALAINTVASLLK